MLLKTNPLVRYLGTGLTKVIKPVNRLYYEIIFEYFNVFVEHRQQINSGYYFFPIVDDHRLVQVLRYVPILLFTVP